MHPGNSREVVPGRLSWFDCSLKTRQALLLVGPLPLHQSLNCLLTVVFEQRLVFAGLKFDLVPEIREELPKVAPNRRDE